MECVRFRDDMLEVLYGEADAETKRRWDQHQTSCPTCREELAGLLRLRGTLESWPLPASLSPAREGAAGGWARVARRGLAAAAVLLVALGAALGLSGSELRFQDGQLDFRLGRGPAGLEEGLAAQQRRHRQEIEELRAALAELRTPRGELRLVGIEDLIRESEQRQALLLRAGLSELATRIDAQRRYDLARVSAGLSYLDGRSGEQLARTSELLGYVLQAAQVER